MLDLIIQTAPDAIVTVDADGLVLSFSPAAERMFGYAAEEVIGRNVSLLMPEPHARRHDDHMRRYLETGEKRVIGIGRKVRARRRDGTVFPAEIAVGELAHGDRHVFTGFVRDIGDQEAAERRAAQLQRLLDQASRLQNLGEISSAISHEVSQPLSAVTTFARAAARLLDGGAPDVAAARGHLDRVAQEAQRAAEILKRMRRLVERGAGDLRPEDLNALVQEAVALSGVAAEHGDVAVRLELAEDLPPVLADRVQIQQVIVNLLINAVEAIAGEPGELRVISELAGHPHIDIRVESNAARQVLLTVGDTGPGVDETVLETLFDPFVTTKRHGLGIGLAVCRTIVESHGGRIWAERNRVGGTDMRFTLPAAAA